MRVIHLSTTTSGGAGRAAARSVDALNLYGTEATLLDRDSVLNSIKSDSTFRSFLISKSSSLITGLQSKIIQKGEELMTPLSLDILTLSGARIEFLKRYDIVHMHAFFNYFSIRKLQSFLPWKPKVVTLHDERLLTGGCHYATSCQGLQELCAHCPKTRFITRPIVKESKRRESMFWNSDQSKGIRLVLPSEWLQEQVRLVPYFDNVNTSVVNNCVPEAFFRSGKTKLDSSKNKLRIGFVATDLDSPYKGFEFFKKAIEHFAHTQKRKVTVILISSVGRRIEPSFNLEWQHLSPVNDEEYIELMDSMNVICVPSLIDNSPNVVIEALACGIPVLASDSGGTGEIPKRISLPTFVFGNLRSFCTSLQNLINMGPLNSFQEAKVRELISEKAHAKNLMKVYSSLI